jgi:aminoglycoside phosphotransferase (APT) family kinase protein
MDNTALLLSRVDLAQVARKGLQLPEGADVTVSEVTRWANLNYVFRVTAQGDSMYLKVVTDTPKLMKINLPKERIFFEAEAIRKFRELCGSGVVVPEVLFVDREAYALGMSDVGGGRRVLMEVIDDRYSLLTAQADALGTALGKVHSSSRGSAPFRPEQFERILQNVVVGGLLAPGAKALFEEHWPAIAGQMLANRECVIHGDLWAKNLLVSDRAAPAIVDFEGCSIGDPAFDIGTLLAVAAIPALNNPALIDSCIEFTESLIAAYSRAAKDNLWARDGLWPATVCARAYLYAGTFLAARGFGPFAYAMSDEARRRLAALARSLSVEAPTDLRQYCDRLIEHCPVEETAL